MSRMIKLADALKKTRLAAVALEIGGASGSYEDRPETKKMLDYAIRESENFIRENGPPDELDGCYVPDYDWLSLYTDIYRSIDGIAKGVDVSDYEAVIVRIILGVRSFGIHTHYGEGINNNEWCAKKMYRALSVNIRNYFEKPPKEMSAFREYDSRIRPSGNEKYVQQNCESLQNHFNSIISKLESIGVSLSQEDFFSDDFNCSQGLSEENKIKMYQKALSVIYNKINQDPAGYISGNEDFFKEIIKKYSVFFTVGNFIAEYFSIETVLDLVAAASWVKLLASVLAKSPQGVVYGLAGIGLSTYSKEEIAGFSSCISPKIKDLFQQNLNLRRSIALLTAYFIIGKDMPEGKKISVAGKLIDPSSESELEAEKERFSKIVLEDILGDYSPYLSCYDSYPGLSIFAAKIMGFDV
jgi:hypothetical protein